MNAADACAVCKVAITPARSFISDTGVLCADCFRRWEREQQIAQNAAAANDAGMFVHASRLAGLHAINWGVAFILLAGWVAVPTWLSSALIAGVFVLAVAMRFRSRIAFHAALALDTGGALILLVVSITHLQSGRLLILLFPILFGLWLAFLTWRARSVFAALPGRL